MPSASRFLLKDSHPLILENAADDGVEPQGRSYDPDYAAMPGGIRIDEINLGLEMACVAISDDKPDTLKKVGKTNPWQVEAMIKVMGTEEAAHWPLTQILETKFNLQVDELMDISGFRAGYAIDTQGYIAHNDEMVVLAYRCTTSGLDWLTNMSTSTSAWEHEDIALGHSGHLSCVDGLCCTGDSDFKPRVHTGFYNNFISSAPAIMKYIDPLLAADQPPRKLYVVGHSLGAGIATMATCYFLMQHNWEELPHRLVSVNAGGPRSCCKSMKGIVEEKMAILKPLDKAVIYRVVRDKDCVPSVPPELFGFTHLDTMIYVTKDDKILINPNLSSSHVVKKRTIKMLLKKNPNVKALEIANEDDSDSGNFFDMAAEEKKDEESKYDKTVKVVPRAFRDHMPDFYLVPINKLHRKVSPPVKEVQQDTTDGEEDPIIEIKEEKKGPAKLMSKVGAGIKKKKKGRFLFGRKKEAETTIHELASC